MPNAVGPHVQMPDTALQHHDCVHLRQSGTQGHRDQTGAPKLKMPLFLKFVCCHVQLMPKAMAPTTKMTDKPHENYVLLRTSDAKQPYAFAHSILNALASNTKMAGR